MKKAKKEDRIERRIKLPSDIHSHIEDKKITLKIGNKELTSKVDDEISIHKDGEEITLSAARSRRKEKRKLGTAEGHIKNMIEGLAKGFEYELEMCNVHFPMTVTFDKAKSEFIIKNLLGEKYPRTVKAGKNVEVEIKAPHIKIKSYDIEEAGTTATNLEKTARIRNRDRNKFQDGIFITKKPGKHYL
jgi:large subunit ribosomal protein L6